MTLSLYFTFRKRYLGFRAVIFETSGTISQTKSKILRIFALKDFKRLCRTFSDVKGRFRTFLKKYLLYLQQF